jgi:hypothetical protein
MCCRVPFTRLADRADLLKARVQAVEAKTRDGIAEQPRFLCKWEFEAHRR